MKAKHVVLCFLVACFMNLYCSSQQLLLNKACKCGDLTEYHKIYKNESMNKLTGGRSRMSIKNIVENKVYELNYAYNQRLKIVPELKGKITIKFAIDECGKVVYSETVGSTVNDKYLENQFEKLIKGWKFGKILKPGDVTEVVYPFNLAKNNP